MFPLEATATTEQSSCAFSGFLTHCSQEHTKVIVDTTEVGRFVKQQEIIGTAPQPRVCRTSSLMHEDMDTCFP